MQSLSNLIFIFFISPFILFSQPQSVVLHLSDWGIDSIGSLRLAQCALIHGADGTSLEVQSLFDERAFAPGAAESSSTLPLANFNGQFINLLGGSSSTFEGNGAAASARHVISVNRVEAVSVSYSKSGDGYCGYWMHLFNSAAPRSMRRYVNGDPYGYLLFLIRGASDNQRARLKIADEAWNDKEDAMTIGDCGQYVPAGHITTSWQVARVPLEYIPSRLDKSKLAMIVFEALAPSSGTFEIGSIVLSTNPEASPFDLGNDVPASLHHERALWVWDTKAILEHHEEDSLLQFLSAEHFDNVYLGLPYDAAASGVEGGVTLDPATLGPLIGKMTALGIRVHALTGDKDFILPRTREFVRKTMEHIVQYNAAVPSAQRFFAVHLDVEPYLIPGFTSPKQSWYLQRFLDMMNDCSAMAHAGGLQIGADIPPWYDSANELTHEYMRADSVSPKPFYQQLMDMLDNITLMDYRTTTDGDNSIVMFAIKELEYAEEHGKKIFIGLETYPLPDEQTLTFRGAMTRGIPQQTPAMIVMKTGVDEAEFTYVQTRDDLEGWLLKKKSREGMYYWPGVVTSEVPSSRSTFATLGRERLEDALQKAERVFRQYRSFAGFAIHSYRSYSKMGK